MEEADNRWFMIRTGVSVWIFCSGTGSPGSPKQRAIEWLLLLCCCRFISVCLFQF